MPRVCYALPVKPALMGHSVERHRAVWPEVLRALNDAGRHCYSIFLRADGLLVGYYETDDDQESARLLAADPRTEAWERESATYFADFVADRPDQGLPQLHEVFNLDDQLGHLDSSELSTICARSRVRSMNWRTRRQ